jgi:cytochrome P450
MVAGSDTTSTALASTTHYMVKNSQCLAEATKEVRDIFKDLNEIVHGPALSSCVYLRSCIDEGDPPPINWSEKFANGSGLRLCPPVPGYLPRKITRDGTTIDGESLPAGVSKSLFLEIGEP